MERRRLVAVTALIVLAVTVFYSRETVHECPPNWLPLQDPSRHHPLGTDPIGRDVLCLIIAGYSTSVLVGITALLSSFSILVLTAIASTFRSGRSIANEVSSILIGLPEMGLLLVFTLIARMTPLLIGLTIGFISSMKGVRGVAASARQTMVSPYVEASKALGAGYTRIAVKHVFPDTASTIISYASMASATAVFAEAALSTLGLGDPSVPSWGRIIGLVLETPGAVLSPPGLIQVAVTLFLIVAMATFFYSFASMFKREGNV